MPSLILALLWRIYRLHTPVRGEAIKKRDSECNCVQILDILNCIPDSIFVKDRQHSWVFLNDTACKLLGHAREELIGKSDYDFFAKAEADVFWEKDELVFTTGVANENEEYFTDATGVRHVFSTKKSLFIDEQGNQFIIGISHDVTKNVIPLKETQQALQNAYGQMESLVLERTQQLSLVNEALQDKITQLENTESALRESEARIQKLAANLPGMLYEFELRPDGSMCFPYVSSGCYELYEMTPEQIQGDVNSIVNIVHPDDSASFFNSIDISARTLQPWLWEGRIILPSNKIKWVKGTSRPEQQADARIIWYGVLLDVTARKETQAALQESELKYRTFVETSKDIIWSANAEGYLTFVNQAVNHVYGYKPEEMIGKNFSQFLPPEQVEIDLQVFQDFLHVESVSEYETVHLNKNGELLNLVVNSIPLKDEAGNVIGRTGTSRNITERKKAEKEQARLIKILEATPDYVAISNAEGDYIYMNPAGRNILGISEEENITKFHFSQFLGARAVEILPQEMPKLIRDGLWTGESSLKHRDGTEIPTLVVTIAHKDDNGEVEYLSAISRDISDIKIKEAKLAKQAHSLQHALEQLQRTQIQLVQSEKMSSLGQLVAGVAHEINNPTSFIYGNLSYAEEYFNDLIRLLGLYKQHYPHPAMEITSFTNQIDLDFLISDLPQIFDSMKSGAERIRKIVLSLRNFSRLDEASMKSVDIHEGLNSTLMILENRLKNPEKRPEIQVIKEYSQLPLVECWAGELNQVFLNILTNAIDALEESFIKNNKKQLIINIDTELIVNNQVKIIIADNANGIPENIKQRIFDPFFTTKAVGKGTGMGLAISYQTITEKHHGSLECFSELGQGTKFIITIPLVQ